MTRLYLCDNKRVDCINSIFSNCEKRGNVDLDSLLDIYAYTHLICLIYIVMKKKHVIVKYINTAKYQESPKKGKFICLLRS